MSDAPSGAAPRPDDAGPGDDGPEGTPRTREPEGAPRARDDGKAIEVLTEPTLVYRLIWTGCWLGSRLLHRVRIEGLEHLPEGGCLVASNHQSFIDIPLLAAVIPRHVSFVARDSLAKSKPLAYIMERCGAVLVKRGASDRRAMREMSTHLKLGDCISIFPEGTRSIDGKVGEFKGGALLAARMAGVPIVPAAIRGGLRVLPRGKSFPRLAKLAVTFGSPIEPKAPDALERLQEAVEAMVGDGEIR